MKLQYKISLALILFGISILIPLFIVYEKYNYNILIEKESQNIESIAKEISKHMDSHMKEKIAISLTLSVSEILKQALQKSNSEFASLTDVSREKKIDLLDKKWMSTNELSDPFIDSYMSNPVAKYLMKHQEILPGMYGEIFLTNRYGAMIATTKKLTTLAHAHKYWWKAGYYEGKGRIFLDDRGFDNSAEGYVLGVVVPVKNGNEVIGILKCNVNIKNAFADIEKNHAKRQIVRTNGLVVAEYNAQPLASRVDEALLPYLKAEKAVNETVSGVLVSIAQVKTTLGSEKIGFGGSYESIDHIMGNTGEAWYVVVSYDKKSVAEENAKTTKIITVVGFVFLFIVLILAVLIGKFITRPIEKLSVAAKKIGSGDLQTRVLISSNDEIGFLSRSVNEMAENLQNTMTKKEELLHERNIAQSYLDVVGVIVVILDVDGNILLFNKKACEITGYKVDEVLGKNWFDIFIPLDIQDEVKAVFDTVIWEEKLEYIPHTNQIVTKGCSQRIIAWNGISIRDENNNPAGLLSSGTDITEEVTAKEELKKKEEMMFIQSRHAAMGDMIAMIAHQWRQPITTIGMAANNILINIELDEEINDDYLKKEMQIVSDQTQYLSKTIDDFRNFFQPNKEKEKVFISDVYKETMHIIGKSLENNNITIYEQIDETVEMEVFKSELIQVFLNIFSNAKDAIKSKNIEDGVINIKIEKKIDTVIIEICDNGGGIPHDDLKKITEPYYSTKSVNGTGLGLYMAETIIKKHFNGILAWENRVGNHGKGACFIIVLPTDLDSLTN